VEHPRDELVITTDPARVDVDAVHAYLSGESYWARGVARERLERAIRHSLCFSVLDADRQVGFARVVTDRATFAYLCDVYLLAPYRGRGLGIWLMDTVRAHPDLSGLRRWLLATRASHPFYERLGWRRADPSLYMDITRPSAAEEDLVDDGGAARRPDRG
jgi:GNAT superfamily N-acetyltransferase